MTDREHEPTEPDQPDETAPAVPSPVEEPGPGIPWGLTVALLLAFLLVVFAVQNTQPVALTFLAWEWELPLVVMIVTVIVVSVVATELLGWVLRRRRRRRAHERQELRRFRSER